MRAAQAAMERTAPRDILESAGGTAAAAAEAERSGGICYIRATSRGPQRYVNGRWVSFSAAVPDDEAPPASERTAPRTADQELDESIDEWRALQAAGRVV